MGRLAGDFEEGRGQPNSGKPLKPEIFLNIVKGKRLFHAIGKKNKEPGKKGYSDSI